jgi:hypothetical protein
VGQLVTDHIDGLGKALEELSVTIAVDHLASIPEGVIVVSTVMTLASKRMPRSSIELRSNTSRYKY